MNLRRFLAACVFLSTSACSGSVPQDEAASGTEFYPAVSAIVDTTCGFARCHAPGPLIPGGGLVFAPEANLHDVLVNVPACEYPPMMRVAPGDPEHSWLMVKLTAPRNATGVLQFEPADEFAATDCGIPGFGFGMPALGTFSLDPDEIEAFRRWILAGAGGPS